MRLSDSFCYFTLAPSLTERVIIDIFIIREKSHKELSHETKQSEDSQNRASGPLCC
jgi:hypothetical protein